MEDEKKSEINKKLKAQETEKNLMKEKERKYKELEEKRKNEKLKEEQNIKNAITSKKSEVHENKK